MKTKTEYANIFSKLENIIKPYESKLELITDSNIEYCLNTSHLMENKKQLFFAAVKTGKTYVSFYLMPVYVFPDLTENISPELKKRMHGNPVLILKLWMKNFLRNYPYYPKQDLTGIIE